MKNITIKNENSMINAFLEGYASGGFHRGMINFNHMRIEMVKGDFTFDNFSDKFKNLIHLNEYYFNEVSGEVSLERLIELRREISHIIRGFMDRLPEADIRGKMAENLMNTPGLMKNVESL